MTSSWLNSKLRETAQWVKALSAKFGNRSSIPGSHKREGRKREERSNFCKLSSDLQMHTMS